MILSFSFLCFFFYKKVWPQLQTFLDEYQKKVFDQLHIYQKPQHDIHHEVQALRKKIQDIDILRKERQEWAQRQCEEIQRKFKKELELSIKKEKALQKDLLEREHSQYLHKNLHLLFEKIQSHIISTAKEDKNLNLIEFIDNSYTEGKI
jgi:F0F1-type ATP synthase membrane subunit b/b'